MCFHASVGVSRSAPMCCFDDTVLLLCRRMAPKSQHLNDVAQRFTAVSVNVVAYDATCAARRNLCKPCGDAWHASTLRPGREMAGRRLGVRARVPGRVPRRRAAERAARGVHAEHRQPGAAAVLLPDAQGAAGRPRLSLQSAPHRRGLPQFVAAWQPGALQQKWWTDHRLTGSEEACLRLLTGSLRASGTHSLPIPSASLTLPSPGFCSLAMLIQCAFGPKMCTTAREVRVAGRQVLRRQV